MTERNILEMSKDPQDVFKCREDYERWEPYILQCDLIEGLSDDERTCAKQGIKNLKEILGKNFLKRAFRQRHPLIQSFLQATSWRRVKLGGLAEALEALKGAENFSRILHRIKADPEKDLFSDGYSVLQTAYQFFKAGFRVCFVDEKGSGKKPDIKLIEEITGEEILVEVTTLNTCANVQSAHRASWPVFTLIFGPLAQADLAMYAEMQEGFDEDYAPIAVKWLKEIIAEVKVSGELRELVNEYIVAGIAPETKIEQLNQWAAQRRIRPDVSGPPIFFSELSRLQRKVREKMEEGQLPNDKPAILVIPALSSFLFHFYDLNEILHELEKQANTYPNLIAIILSHGYAEDPLGEVVVREAGAHTVINRTDTGFIEPIIVIRNQAFALSLSPSTFAKISRAFS